MSEVPVVVSSPLAVFRCDASPAIGVGHVSRCLALAEAFADAGWRIAFVVGAETVGTAPTLAASGFERHVLPDGDDELDIVRAAAGNGADLLVVDHYQRDAVFERACRPFARKILVLDDATERDHDCDVLIDSAAPSAEIYSCHVPPSARILTGPNYALIQRSFLARREAALARRDGRPVRNVLVSCGAIDPLCVTAAALDALAARGSEIAVTAVLSSKAPHVAAIRANLRPHARLLTDVADMAALMTEADLAVGAPGVTAYERAILGLPSVVVTIADNQRGVARVLVDAGAASDAGIVDAGLKDRIRVSLDTLMDNAEARSDMSRAAARLVDGRAATRVMLACLNEAVLKDGKSLRLRAADEGDEAWLLDLQRQPETRRFFRNPAIPEEGEHHRWMERTLADPAKLLLVAEVESERVGFIRLDRKVAWRGQPCHEVSIAVHPRHTNRGIATLVLGCARQLMPRGYFEAEIGAANVASQRAFARAGYEAVAANRYRLEPVH